MGSGGRRREVIMSPSKIKKMRATADNDDMDEERIDYSLMSSFEIDESGMSGPSTRNLTYTASSLLAGLTDVKRELKETFSGYVEETFKDPEIKLYWKVCLLVMYGRSYGGSKGTRYFEYVDF